MKQQQNHSLEAGATGAGAGALDAIRIDQFLDLQRDLLLATADADTLPERLVQRIAVFLGTAGAAVGAVHGAVYRLLAAYGVGPAYCRRWAGVPAADPALAPALGGTRPLVLEELDGDVRLRTILLPFRLPEVNGALHVVVGERTVVPDDDLRFARALAGVAGIALANARQCGRLAQMARSRGEALTAMAHDLRAPLNALVGYTGLLGEGAFGPLTREQQEVAGTLERQATELVDLLGATLDVARLETGRLPLRLEEFALARLLSDLAAGTFAHASRAGALVLAVPSELPPLRTDRVKVKEIAQNLIDNALKHGRAPVRVEATLAPDGTRVRLTVRDAGPGIGPDVLPHLFEPFRPGAGSGRGTGFGLYLVRCFSEALGGRVAAQSRPGEGSAITVELPLALAGPGGDA